MERKIVEDIINILLEIPKGTHIVRAKSEFFTNEGKQMKAEAEFNLEDIEDMRNEYTRYKDEYWEDNPQMAVFPICLGTYEIAFTFVSYKDGKETEDVKMVYLPEITKMRDEFIRCLHDDDYNAVYQLTDKMLRLVHNELQRNACTKKERGGNMRDCSKCKNGIISTGAYTGARYVECRLAREFAENATMEELKRRIEHPEEKECEYVEGEPVDEGITYDD